MYFKQMTVIKNNKSDVTRKKKSEKELRNSTPKFYKKKAFQ